MPGARVVSTDVATETAAAMRPRPATTWPPRNRSTMSASPPPGPPLAAIAPTTRTTPTSQPKKPGEREAREGQRAGTELQRHDGDRQPEAAAGRRRRTPSPNRYSENSCGIAPVSSIGVVGVDTLDAEERADHGGRRRARATTTPMNSRPIRLWSVGGDPRRRPSPGNDPIADSPRAAPYGIGLESTVVMYMGLDCRARRSETIARPTGD